MNTGREFSRVIGATCDALNELRAETIRQMLAPELAPDARRVTP